MMETLAEALLHAKPRWGDSGYGTRMAVNFIIEEAGATLGALGFGLYVNTIADNEHSVPVVDWDTQTVSLFDAPRNFNDILGHKRHPIIWGLAKTPKFTMPLEVFVKRFGKKDHFLRPRYGH
jgi:hypothetical protein